MSLGVNNYDAARGWEQLNRFKEAVDPSSSNGLTLPDDAFLKLGENQDIKVVRDRHEYRGHVFRLPSSRAENDAVRDVLLNAVKEIFNGDIPDAVKEAMKMNGLTSDFGHHGRPLSARRVRDIYNAVENYTYTFEGANNPQWKMKIDVRMKNHAREIKSSQKSLDNEMLAIQKSIDEGKKNFALGKDVSRLSDALYPKLKNETSVPLKCGKNPNANVETNKNPNANVETNKNPNANVETNNNPNANVETNKNPNANVKTNNNKKVYVKENSFKFREDKRSVMICVNGKAFVYSPDCDDRDVYFDYLERIQDYLQEQKIHSDDLVKQEKLAKAITATLHQGAMSFLSASVSHGDFNKKVGGQLGAAGKQYGAIDLRIEDGKCKIYCAAEQEIPMLFEEGKLDDVNGEPIIKKYYDPLDPPVIHGNAVLTIGLDENGAPKVEMGPVNCKFFKFNEITKAKFDKNGPILCEEVLKDLLSEAKNEKKVGKKYFDVSTSEDLTLIKFVYGKDAKLVKSRNLSNEDIATIDKQHNWFKNIEPGDENYNLILSKVKETILMIPGKRPDEVLDMAIPNAYNSGAKN